MHTRPSPGATQQCWAHGACEHPCTHDPYTPVRSARLRGTHARCLNQPQHWGPCAGENHMSGNNSAGGPLPLSGTGNDLTRWLISMGEPLLPARIAAQYESAARRSINDDRSMGSTWFAGVVCDTLLSLPQADPWRNGVMAGTYEDGVDVVPFTGGDVSLDVGLAALVEPLPAQSVLFISRCSQWWESGRM